MAKPREDEDGPEPELPVEHEENDDERREEHVDESSEESFPASDPPSFTPEKGGS